MTEVVKLFAINEDLTANFLARSPLARFAFQLMHFLNRNTKSGSKRNISAHYDLGNAFYREWLDRSMTYSSAIFEAGDNDLSSAQERKYRRLAEAMGVKPGEHVLEIGCGWGGFAEYLARECGAKVRRSRSAASSSNMRRSASRMPALRIGSRFASRLP